MRIINRDYHDCSVSCLKYLNLLPDLSLCKFDDGTESIIAHFVADLDIYELTITPIVTVNSEARYEYSYTSSVLRVGELNENSEIVF